MEVSVDLGSVGTGGTTTAGQDAGLVKLDPVTDFSGRSSLKVGVDSRDIVGIVGEKVDPLTIGEVGLRQQGMQVDQFGTVSLFVNVERKALLGLVGDVVTFLPQVEEAGDGGRGDSKCPGVGSGEIDGFATRSG